MWLDYAWVQAAQRVLATADRGEAEAIRARAEAGLKPLEESHKATATSARALLGKGKKP